MSTLSDPYELPIFSPRFGNRGHRASDRQSSSLRYAVLALARRGARRQASGRAGAGDFGARMRGARRVIVKAHFVRLTASSMKAATMHLRYIERDGVEKDGAKGVLYDGSGPARREAFEEARVGEKHQFRVIVSPEDAGELDLTAYVRSLMGRIERDLGRRLEWAAVNHYDTEHPHAHLVVRGVDRDGHELRFDRSYISNGLRWRAQELATEELGPRREEEVQRARVKEVTQHRFTSLDRELERRATDSRLKARGPQPRAIDSVLIGRLEHLEQMRLAERTSPNEWALAPGWKESLRRIGTQGDIIKQLHAAVSVGDPVRYHVVRAGQALQPDASDGAVVTGRVASKGLSDELKGVFYAVVETPAGSAYHVPLDRRSAESLRPGDVVSLTTKPEPAVRPIDRHISEVAAALSGVYDLALDPSADAERAVRRMRDLERLALAVPAGPNRWKIAPRLVEELERRHQDLPARHRLLLHKQPLSLEAQVRNPGPVWLDRVDGASLAPYGLGAEIQRAIERRRDALRRIGIAPDDPKRMAKLRELERGAVGRDIAASLRQTFIVDAPKGFRGCVVASRASPTGTPYAVVSDGERFVLLKSTPSLRALQGQLVVLSRDTRGRLVARGRDDRGLER